MNWNDYAAQEDRPHLDTRCGKKHGVDASPQRPYTRRDRVAPCIDTCRGVALKYAWWRPHDGKPVGSTWSRE